MVTQPSLELLAMGTAFRNKQTNFLMNQFTDYAGISTKDKNNSIYMYIMSVTLLVTY